MCYVGRSECLPRGNCGWKSSGFVVAGREGLEEERWGEKRNETREALKILTTVKEHS